MVSEGLHGVPGGTRLGDENLPKGRGKVDTASMPAKMRRMARARLDRVNNEYQRATRVVESFCKRTEDARRRGVHRPVVVTERSRSIGTTSALDAPPT